jgi:hypothetical protein
MQHMTHINAYLVLMASGNLAFGQLVPCVSKVYDMYESN